MKKMNYLGISTAFFALTVLFVSCGAPAVKKDASTEDTTVVAVATPDMAAIKAEIQALETSWANADNARDANAIAAFYSDDAISLSNNKPMLSGKAAILKDIEQSIATRVKGSTVSYDVQDVFGCENSVTEVGLSTFKDASGKVISTGKYMAVWEKRDGKYVCVRDIYNEDAKEK